MPRFYFDIHDGTRESRDEEGSDYMDLDAAREEAAAVLPALVASGAVVRGNREIVATVRGQDGRPLFRTRLTLTSELLDTDRRGSAT